MSVNRLVVVAGAVVTLTLREASITKPLGAGAVLTNMGFQPVVDEVQVCVKLVVAEMITGLRHVAPATLMTAVDGRFVPVTVKTVAVFTVAVRGVMFVTVATGWGGAAISSKDVLINPTRISTMDRLRLKSINIDV